jgi:hypothetical protein
VGLQKARLLIIDGYGKLLAGAVKPWYESQSERQNLAAWLGRMAASGSSPERIAAALLMPVSRMGLKFAPVRESYLREMTLGAELELHRRRTGSFPEALADVSLTYLKEPPVDPFSGRSFIYGNEGDGYVLHSVGENGKDDGGKWAPREGPDDIAWTVSVQEGK